MTAAVLVAAAVLLVVVVVLLVVRRSRRPADGVADFRRQIDALGPQARRSVVDEVQRIDDEKKGQAAAPDDRTGRHGA